MICVDDRERGIVEELSKLGVATSTMRLEYADAMWSGNGPDGECLIGCERKRLSDLVNSMKDRRLSGHQLRGLQSAYDYVFLFVEAVFRSGPGGEIEELQGREFRPFYSRGAGARSAISYQQLLAYLTTLEVCGNIIVRRTSNARETAAQWAALWQWWNGKKFADHHSHDQIYTGTPMKGHGSEWGSPHAHDEGYGKYGGGRGRATVTQAAPTTAWRCASQFPGLDRRAEKVARHFRTLRRMTLAGVPDSIIKQIEAWEMANPKAAVKAWSAVDFGTDAATGRKNPGVGPVTAAAVIRAITEEGA